MKYCTKCGYQLEDDASFCPKCGTSSDSTMNTTDEFSFNNDEEVVNQSNGMAVAGFICSFFIPLLGWIFGGIGLARANERGGKGKGFAIAALIIATVMFIINLVYTKQVVEEVFEALNI